MIMKGILLLITFCCSLVLRAQEQVEPHFQHINTRGHIVKVLSRDRDGVMWLGTTSGLLSLPQLESRNPQTYDRRHPDLNASIRNIQCDSLGHLWITTNDNDNLRYRPADNGFERMDTATFLRHGAAFSKDYHLLVDLTGSGWIWKDGTLAHFTAGSDQEHTMLRQPAHSIRFVSRSADGVLVVCTDEALHFLSASSGRILHATPLPTQNRVHQLYAAPDGVIWLNYFSRIERFDYRTRQWLAPITLPSQVRSITIDDKGLFWVATNSDGIYIFDRQGQTRQHLRHNPWDASSLLSDAVHLVYYDPALRAIWVTYTKGGMSVCNPHNSSFITHSITNPAAPHLLTDVISLTEAANQSGIYVGMENRGAYFRPHDSQQWRQVLADASVISLYSESDGTLWAGLYSQGLVRIDPSGHRTTYFSTGSPFAITRTGQEILVALLARGIWSLDPRTGNVQDTHIGPLYAYDIRQYGSTTYAATTEGLYRRDGSQSWQCLHTGNYRSLRIDSRGYIWLLGGEGSEGLSVFDPQGDPVDVPLGLDRAPLRSIECDDQDRIWIMYDNVLLQLGHSAASPSELTCNSTTVNHDADNIYYNFNSSTLDHQGNLWLGSSQGYQCFGNVAALTSETSPSLQPFRLVLGSLSINDITVCPGSQQFGHEILQGDILHTHHLELRHNENNLILEFSHVDGGFLDNESYLYQLRGLSDQWHPVKDNMISLSSLPSGHYELLLCSRNVEAKTLLTIHIAPPLWNTWWAWLLYALLLAGLGLWAWRNYTHRRHLRAKVQQMQLRQQQETHINEMKLRFFTNISHDLRTPLSLIISPIEELIADASLTAHRSTLQMIHRNAQLLHHLVSQILDFRRLEFGREQVNLSYGDIVSLVSGVCQSFVVKAQKENIQFAFRPSAERIDTLFDNDKTTKILMNLLSNAFKFTPSSGAIAVAMQLHGDEIFITVTDSGVGIPDTDKPHIFDRFYQSEHSHQDQVGSGIGLHIAREYTRLQGGDITVADNPEGVGTQFCVTIPLRKQEQLAVAQPVEVQQLVADEAPASEPEGVRLLLVDDNPDFLSYLSQSLSAHYQVTCASNGQQAWQLLQEQDIDILVSDVMMDQMDGLELCRRVKTNLSTSHIAVVLLTAKSLSTDELAGLEAGADDYITKPFHMDILRQRVARLVEQHQQHQHRFANEVDISPSDITITSLDQQLIEHAIAVIEAHIEDPEFGVEQLSEELNMHRSNLYKKLQHITGQTPIQFIRLIRLKRGRQLLEQSGMYISEVAYRVGFNSPRLFSRYFKEAFGFSPSDMGNS